MKKIIKDHLGNEYNTAKEMCEHYGIPERCFNSRINKLGWSIEESLTTPVNRIRASRKNLQTKDGRKFSSLHHVEKETGIPRATIAKRLKEGLSLDDALSIPVNGGPKKFVDHKGTIYSSMAAAGRAYGLSPETITKRLESGWEIEKALTTPVKNCARYKKGERVKQYNGQIAEILEINGLRGTVLFEDGTKVKNISLAEFRRGRVGNPNIKKTRVGETIMANCGLMMTIIEDENKKRITVQFEDGAIRKGISYWSFKAGKVSHPTFCADPTKTGEFMGYKVRALLNAGGDVYYQTEDLRTGEKDIMTIKQMLEHKEHNTKNI